jgi:hypothetical protein
MSERSEISRGTATPAGGIDRTAGNGTAGGRRGANDPVFQVRNSDVEPYTGLRYLSKLFRLMAVIILLLLIAEVSTGLYSNGAAALPTLLSEVSRLIVLAGLLWGVGDLAILLIDVGHDVRASRILLGRQVAHHMMEHTPERGAGERIASMDPRADS